MRIACFVLTLLLLLVGLVLFGSMRNGRELRKQLEEERRLIAELQTKNADQKIPDERARPRLRASNDLETLRLRGEVTVLRRQLAELTNAVRPDVSDTSIDRTDKTLFVGDRLLKSRNQAEITPHDEAVRLELNRKEQALRYWWEAILAYAEANNGYLPTQLAEASGYLPGRLDSTTDPTAIDLANFTRRTSGSAPVNLATIDEPSRTVLFKERTPLVLSDGLRCNIYLFADGSIELFDE